MRFRRPRRANRPNRVWSLYASIAGVVLFGGLALAFGFSRSKLARKLGEAKGKLNELEHEIRRLRGAMLVQGDMVKELSRPDPTPGVLGDVLRREAAAAGFSDD